MNAIYATGVSIRARLGACAMLVLASSMAAKAETPPVAPAALKHKFTLKHGTDRNDSASGITTDAAGNVYLAGNTWDAEPSGFLRKYAPEGTLLWEKTKPLVSIDGIALDKDGNSYISGSYITATTRPQRHFIYLEKHDAYGNLLWAKSLRAAPASDPTRMAVNGVAIDPSGNGSVLVLFERSFWPYQTTQVFIRKYNSAGSGIWEKLVGSSSPYTGRPVFAVDQFGLIRTAVNTHSLNTDWNTNISHFDRQGNVLNSIPFHPAASPFETRVHAITTDLSGNFLVAGITKGNLDGWNKGFFDAFVRKYDNTGHVLWTRQFGTSENDYANGVTADAAGNVHVSGSTSGNLSIATRGSFDAVVLNYGSTGNLLRSRQFGGVGFDIAKSAVFGSEGDLWVAGHTTGNFGGRNQGLQDVYLMKYSPSR
jgi:hypothetical protein